ncbi:MAG: translation initiation factor IF-2 subunit alpha [Candidatus Nezhaarchaeota archaeon]|nr:translation initiation factor IF-2 subunit alpha [Candidatus Nezhaarchaeota archaeon]MCX8141887.1 translation initiation factor IF-2 subunit alpha [Candidatus Nezhaarchaeota archaeon]MDW8050332.1 translation initiation factor IF-2 subunit alpha [Nitrososphaerota archaeon]
MVKKRREWPLQGEIVIGTIVEVFDKGAYITLDEYDNKKAYLPLNEVSSSWSHNIRDVIREGQKTAFKVIRVNPAKGHIDLSLKRVADVEKERKLLEWKRAKKAEVLLEFAAKKLGKTLNDAYNEVGWKLEDRYGEIYAGLEEVARKGKEPLLAAGVSKEWIEVVTELAKEHIEIPLVKLSIVLELKCYKPNGINIIKKALIEALNYAKMKGYNVKIYADGAPKYRIDGVAEDYKQLKSILREVAGVALEIVNKDGGQGRILEEPKK